MINFLKKEQSELLLSGYLEASVDTFQKSKNYYTATIFKGKQYTTGKINVVGDVDYKSLKSNHIINKKWINTVTENHLLNLEQNGYPFASVEFDSLQLKDNKINGRLVIKKGPFYKIDSLVIKGDIKITPNYIYRYLDIHPGDSYNEKLVGAIDQRIKEIPFLQSIKSSEILFTKNQCIIYVYLKKKNASTFNGIVGILPDAQTGKTTITGDARIILKNAFGKAEVFDLNWRKIANKTQDLKTSLHIPFWFNSPIGSEMGLKIYKRDTSFLEMNKLIGLSWQMNKNNLFRIFYNRYDSDILSKTFYTSGGTNLQNSDLRINNYGIGLRFEKLDYRLNPRSGIVINTEGTAGIKTIQENASNDATIYSNEKLKTENYSGHLQFDTYIPILKSFTVKIGNQSRFLMNQKIFRNELYRIGGIKTLRGFDEESILCSSYTIFTGEFRILFEENSNVFAFFDQAWYENNSTLGYYNDYPLGFGAGVNFQVKAGIFSFTWALGKQLNNPVLLKNSKLHFGFISYF